MKKIIVAFFALGAAGIFVLAGLGLSETGKSNEKDFLRLHVRANSNSTVDQDVKYLVKQEIVNELTPIFVGVTSRVMAMEVLEENMPRIEAIANGVLVNNGLTYTAKVAIKTETFPTRTYNNVTLPDGIYDALIINLGEGKGDNWWCVVYPPLCFLENNIGGSEGVKYRSKLLDIIKRTK